MTEFLPKGWHTTNIGASCEVLDSYRVPINSSDRSKRRGSYPYYGANGVQGYIDDYIFDGEHVLLAEDGGHFGEWDSRPISYLVSGKFWVNNHAHILRGKGGYSTRYIHYSLVHKNILKYINGGTRSKLNQSDMREIEVLAPPEREQQKIATILSSVDDVIEKTRAQIDKLKDLKNGMMQDFLTQGLGHTEFKDSPVGRIPKSWQHTSLKELCAIITKGTTPTTYGNSYTEKGINFIKVESIRSDGIIDKSKFSFIDKKTHRNLSRSILEEGDILITIAGATVGKLAIVRQEHLPANTNQALAVVRIDQSKVFRSFVYYWLQSAFIKNSINGIQTIGAQPNLSLAQIGDFGVAIPGIKEQQKIVDSLSAVDDLIAYRSKKVLAAELLKKALMEDLLTGTVRVKIKEKQKESEVA